MAEPRTVLIAAGGTAGHVHLGLAVAQALAAIDPATRVVLSGTETGMETRLVPQAGLPLERIAVRPIRGGSRARALLGLLSLPAALLDAERLLRRVRPDVVLGVGGHVSGVVVASAASRRVPVAVLEANVELGLANRLAARLCAMRFAGWDETARHFGEPTVVSGIPVREDVLAVRAPSAEDGALRLLVLGGSMGSSLVDDMMLCALPTLASLRTRLHVVHQGGPARLDALRTAYTQHGFSARVEPYLDPIGAAYAAADLVVSAAGAVTCAELMLVGRASALIALPVSGGHQRSNLRAMEQRGTSVGLDPASAGPALLALLLDAKGRSGMAERALACARPDAARVVARRLLEMAESR